MADLSLKIKADTDEAQRQFEALAKSSEYMAEKTEKALKKLNEAHTDKFVERQELAAVAMKATGRETEGLNAQVKAYQNEIARLIKTGIDPQNEGLKKLQDKYKELAQKQEDQAEAGKRSAESAKKSAEAEKEMALIREKVAKTSADLLPVFDEYDKKSKEIAKSQNELCAEMEKLAKDGLGEQDEAVRKLQAEYAGLVKEQEANAEAARKTEEAAKEAAKAAEEKAEADRKAAKQALELLLTTDKYEKKTMELKNRQQELKEEMERLVGNGVDPQSESVKKLAAEYGNLEKEIKKTSGAHKMQEDLLKTAEKAAMACYAAIGAGIAAAVAAAQKTAEMGDEYAKTAKAVGMTAEEFQELKYAADQSGFSGDKLKDVLLKLNKGMGDLQKGTGSLDSYLKNNNKTLLDQLKQVKSNEEAFMLLMDAVKETEDPFERAALAQAAFGKTGQDMINMALAGADGIAALREEARGYGLISNEAAEQAEAFMDAQARVKAALEGVRNELGTKLLPGMTDAMETLAKFIASVDDWEKILRVAATALASATAGLTAFLLVSKGHAAVTTLAGAIRTLMAAITGPAGIVGLALAGVVAGISALTALDRKSKNQGKEIAAGLNETKASADKLIDSYGKLNPSKTADREITEEMIRLYPQLSGRIIENATTVKELSEEVKKLSEEQAKHSAQAFINSLQESQKEIDRLRGRIAELSDDFASGGDFNAAAAAGSLQRQLRSQLAEFEKHKKNANDILATVGLEVDIENNFKFIESVETRLERLSETITEQTARAAKSIGQVLGETALTEEQLMNERINQVKAFLRQRADLEKTEGEERIASVEAEYRRILAAGILHGAELTALERGVAESVQEIRDDLAEKAAAAAEAAAEKNEQEKTAAAVKSVKERLLEVAGAEKLARQEAQEKEITEYADFLQRRAALESDDAEERAAFLQETRDRMLAFLQGRHDQELIDEREFADRRVEIEAAAAEAVDRIRDEALEKEKRRKEETLALLEEQAAAFAQFFGGVGALLDASVKAREDAAKAEGDLLIKTSENKEEAQARAEELLKRAKEENAAAAKAAKAVAAAEAAINSMLAFTNVLAAKIPFPGNVAAAAGVLASGIAQQVKILKTPIPSAETGGRFVVPDVGARRVDGVGLRVNPGEEVTVEPRGADGGDRTLHVQFIFEGQAFAEMTNKLGRSGDIHVFQLASNY